MEPLPRKAPASLANQRRVVCIRHTASISLSLGRPASSSKSTPQRRASAPRCARLATRGQRSSLCPWGGRNK